MRLNHDHRASRQVVSLVTDDGSDGFSAMNRLAECYQQSADSKRGKSGWSWWWVRYNSGPRTPEVHGVGSGKWRPMSTDWVWLDR